MPLPDFITDIVDEIAEHFGPPGSVRGEYVTAAFGWLLAALMVLGFFTPGLALIVSIFDMPEASRRLNLVAQYASVIAWPVLMIVAKREWRRIKATHPRSRKKSPE